MPQINVGSSNITTFGFSLTVDIYNRLFTFNTAPRLLPGLGLANTKVSFSLIDQQGVVLATTDFVDAPNYIVPSVTPTWVLNLASLPWQFLFQTYAIQGSIQDANGTVYSTPTIYVPICQPVGLTNTGFVPGTFLIQADCVNNQLNVQDQTVYVLNNLTPFANSQVWVGTLNYPTGTIAPVTFSGPSWQNNVVYTGQYSIQATVTATYLMGTDTYELVTYLTGNLPGSIYTFNVTCQNLISNLLCCINQVQQTAIAHCNDNLGKAANEQLKKITIPLLTGWIAEANGQDSSTQADLIQSILNCNCGQSSLTQNQPSPVNPTIYSIVITGAGGTNVTSSQSGSTRSYVVSSNVYVVAQGVPGDPGFTIQQVTTTPGVVTYLITFNYAALAGEILTAIGGNPTLIAQLNALITATGLSLQGLNGGCIINLSNNSYSLTQAITGATTIGYVIINGIIYMAPTNTFANNQVAVSTWLNSLALGTFVVVSTPSQISIMSSANPNVISTMSFTSPNVVVQFTPFNATLVQVLQAIINYVCALTSYQVQLGTTLSLCTFNYAGQVFLTNYSGSQGAFNAGVASAICNIVNQIYALTTVTCTQLEAIFGLYPNAVVNPGSDLVYGNVGGQCTAMSFAQLVMGIIATINSNATVKNAYCAISCAVPGTCPDIANINIQLLSNTSIGIYGVTFTTPGPTASQTLTVKYRITGTSNFTVSTQALLVLPNGNLSGSSPYVIQSLLPNTTYDIFVVNNCGGLGFLKNITTPANTLYSGSYLLDNNIYNICGDAPVTLYSSVPFASGVTMYTNNTLTTPVTGFNYIAPTSGATASQIFTINPTTGIVGANTGNVCSGGTPGTYILGTNPSTICSNGPLTLYTNGAFGVGGTLYLDSGLTTPVTGYTYVVQQATQNIYNLNATNGIIGGPTGTQCSSYTVLIQSSMGGCSLNNVTGITGFTPSPAFPLNPGGTITGTHSGFTGAISFVMGGAGCPAIPGSQIQVQKNGSPLFTLTVTGAGTYTSGSYSFIATDFINIQLVT